MLSLSVKSGELRSFESPVFVLAISLRLCRLLTGAASASTSFLCLNCQRKRPFAPMDILFSTQSIRRAFPFRYVSDSGT